MCAASYCYSANYHGGQGTRAYRLGCVVGSKGFKPGLTYGIDEAATREDYDASDMMDRLIARNY